MDIQAWIIVAIVAAVIVYMITIYNKLVAYSNRAKNSFSQIDVQLKRRYDLIPNLVETAKGYLKHERQTLEAVIEARNDATSKLQDLAGNLSNVSAAEALVAAEANLGGALGNFRVAVEAYPDLKASANMMQLSEEMTSTENKVAFSRQAYNDAVNTFNIFRQSFPPVMLAGLFGHGKDMAFLKFAEGEELQKAPQVSF